MAYCDWCRLESDSEDSCDWCKRPIRRNYGNYGLSNFDAIASLREEDSLGRATPIIGGFIGLIFVGIVGYALTHLGSAAPVTQVAQVDPSNRIAESEKSWTGQRSGATISEAPIQARPPVRLSSAPPKPNWTQPAPRQSTISNLPSMQANRTARPVDENGLVNQGLLVESAHLSPALMSDGSYSVSGTVNVRNVSSVKAEDFHFWLVAGGTRIKLDCAYASTLGVDALMSFNLSAQGLDRSVVESSDLMVRVEAENAMGHIGDSLPIQ